MTISGRCKPNIAEGAFLFPVIRQKEATTGVDGNVHASFTISPRTTNEVSYAFKTYNVNLFIQDDTAPAVRPSGLTIRDFFPNANTLPLAPGRRDSVSRSIREGMAKWRQTRGRGEKIRTRVPAVERLLTK